MLFKSINLQDAQFKASSGVITGYATKWGVRDVIGDATVKGCFTQSLTKRMPKMFLEHSPTLVIGKWTNAVEDDAGLLLTGQLTPGNRTAEEVKANIEFGAIDSLSIGYVTKGSYKEGDVNYLTELELYETSIVSSPALAEAKIVGLKSINPDELESISTLREFEQMLRDAGMSKSLAQSFLAKARMLGTGGGGAAQSDDMALVYDRLQRIVK